VRSPATTAMLQRSGPLWVINSVRRETGKE
jgi:hypothetical protein